MAQERLAPHIMKVTLSEREILLLGTAHILEESVQEVSRWIEEWQPDTVYVELCEARYQALTSKDRWKNLDIVNVIKSGQGFLMLASLLLTALQKKMGIQLGEEVGEDMLSAIRLAEEKRIPFVLADRDLNTTLKRTWLLASFKDKMRIVEILFESLFETEEVSEEEVKKLLGEGNLYNTMMSELAKHLPAVKRVLIDERNLYMAQKILSGSGKKALVVIGRGHLEGVAEALENPVVESSQESLETIPQSRISGAVVGWLVVILFGLIVVAGFFKGGTGLALSMVRDWILVTGTAAALGCLVAFAHPVTILSSWVIAPLTTLNPFVGAGMFLALIEAFFHKPRVRDFENLPYDITTWKGFWQNRITKILLVFVTSSLGASIGTFIGIPWISRLLK
jgi:pheromone shutdown-related protein TraB